MHLYVEKGLLRSYTIDEAGKEHIIQFASENWIISDRSSSFFHEPSKLFIDAIEETVTVFIGEDFIQKVSDMNSLFRQYNERASHNHTGHLQKNKSAAWRKCRTKPCTKNKLQN